MSLDIHDLHETFALDAVPKHITEYDLAQIPCCWLLTNKETGSTVKLNETSLMIWKLCTGEFTVGDIIGALQENFPDVDSIEKDVQRALDDLSEEQAIRFL